MRMHTIILCLDWESDLIQAVFDMKADVGALYIVSGYSNLSDSKEYDGTRITTAKDCCGSYLEHRKK